MQLKGAQILIATLIEQGVDVLFGYPGGSVIHIYDALFEKRDKLRHILASHEQGAAHAADGYARSTGKTGVVLATSGPGATNLITGIATAYLDSVPLVAITGNVPTDLLGRDSFQEVDITGATVPVTKHNFFVKDASLLAGIVKEAFVIANSGRPGPVLIDIPKDVTAQLSEYTPVGRFERRPFPVPRDDDVATAVRMISMSKRPLIFFGGGVTTAGAGPALLSLAEKIHAPMASSAMGLSAVPYDNSLNLGMIGMHGTPVANHAAANCDLLITVGARFSDRVTGDKAKFAANAKVIQLDVDRSEVGKNIRVNHYLVGNALDVTEALAADVSPRQDNEWVHYLLEYKARHPIPGAVRESGVDPRDVLQAIRMTAGEETVVVTDVGQHQMITAQHYRFVKPRTFVSSCGLGTMGFGMGAAVGACIGNPGKPVVLITGDGCFHMNMAEFAVAVTEHLPIVVVVMNNGVLGMVRQWQKLFHDGRYSSIDLRRQTDFVKLAQAFGGTGLRLSSRDEVRSVIQQAFSIGGPVIVDCLTNPEEDVFPIIPPGGTDTDMIYSYEVY